MSFQFILGNFALILLVLTFFTGMIWCLDTFKLAKQRRLTADKALAEFDERSKNLPVDDRVQQRKDLEFRLLKQPTWIEYTGSFFPVIALVFVLRSFLFEPFKIPSSSMLPTLFVGDLILVNKFTYGIRLPVINKKVIDIGHPQRGDVMVFRFPVDPKTDYIKRVIGVPGDKIEYKNKQLTVNGEVFKYQQLNDFLDEEKLSYSRHLTEISKSRKHNILNDDYAPTFVRDALNFPGKENCQYSVEGFSCTVPDGHYFMMGDNRDNSFDSRYWGFVPEQNIVGRAFFIWMNLGNLKRIGGFE